MHYEKYCFHHSGVNKSLIYVLLLISSLIQPHFSADSYSSTVNHITNVANICADGSTSLYSGCPSYSYVNATVSQT